MADEKSGEEEMFPDGPFTPLPDSLSILRAQRSTEIKRARTTLDGREWRLKELIRDLDRMKLAGAERNEILEKRRAIQLKLAAIESAKDKVASLEAVVKNDPAWRG